MKLKLKLVGALCAIGVMQSASALTVVGNSITNLATEFLGGTTVNLNNIGFNSTSQGVVIGNSLSLRITLSAGTFGSCGTMIQSNVTAGANLPASWTAATGTGTSTCTYSIAGANITTSTTAANTFFLLTGATASAFGNLVTEGINDNGCGFKTGSVTLLGRYFDASGVEVDLPAAGGNGPSGKLNEAIIITAAQGISGAWTAGSAISTTVDVVSNQGKTFVAASGNGTLVAPVGRLRFTNADGTQADNTGTTDYVLTAAAPSGFHGTLTIGLTASTNFPPTTTFFLKPGGSTACANNSGAIMPTTQTITGGTTAMIMYNSGVQGLMDGTDATVATATGTYALCMQIASNSGVVPQMTLTGYAKADRTVYQNSPTANITPISDYANGPTCQATLGKFVYNSGTIEVRNYVPAAQAASGWSNFLRVINAGNTATSIQAYFLGDDGKAGSTGTIISSVAAKGNVTITNAQIEAVLGAAPVGASNPRLVITGNTDSLRVQNYIRQPSGFWIEASSGQDDIVSASGGSYR